MLPHDFLSQMAHRYRLSEDQEKAFLERFGTNKDEQVIADTLHVSRSALTTRMTEIYRKFSIGGKGSGKYGRLLNFLTNEHQKSNASHVSNPNVVEDRLNSPLEWVQSHSGDFVGREKAIADLKTFITQGAKVIVVYGKGGVGKTTLAKKYFELQKLKILELPIGIETEHITPVENWVQNWLKDLNNEKPEQNFLVMLEQLKRILRTSRFGVLIDNLEPALDEQGRFIEAHRCYVELIRVLADPVMQSITLITSRERLNESRVRQLKHYPLSGLDEEAWREFFSKSDIDTDSSTFSKMHKAYGGNAKAMEILCGVVKEDYESNLEIYWGRLKRNLLIEGELKDLIGSQFDRLQRSDPKAYKLLCRQGLYHYQNISKVGIIGLHCLLWDIPEEQREQVVQSLQNRFLIEFRKGEYWLHPVIREEAVARLKSNGESSDELLLLMKQQIDALLASDTKLQGFLEWVYQKSSSVETSYGQMTVRDIYFCLEFNPLKINRPELAYLLDSVFRQDVENCDNSEYFTNPDLSLDSGLYQSLRYALHLSEDIPIWNPILGINSGFAIAESEAYNCNFLELEELLNKLYTSSPLEDLNSSKDIDEEAFDQWWVTKGVAWTEQLRIAMVQYRNIGHNWRFSERQQELLKQYYDANKLLADCLSNTSSVAPAVQEYIVKTLLLPVARAR